MRSLGIYLKPYRAQSILAPLFKLLEALLDLLVPIVVAAMIDTGALGSGRRTVLLYFAALLGMAAVGLGFSVVAQFFAAKASVGFAGGLRQALFDHIQTLSFPELDALGSDTLITRLTDDVNQVQTGLNLSLRLLLRSPFIVLGALVFSFTIDTRCALVFAVAIPVLFLVILGIMLRSVPLFGKVQAGLDRVTALTRENLTGARVIRAFCREDASVAEFAASNEALTRLNLQVGKLSALMNPVTYVLINLATVLLIRQAGLQVELGRLSQGQAVALYNYMLQILVELIKLATMVITLNKSVACARRPGFCSGTGRPEPLRGAKAAADHRPGACPAAEAPSPGRQRQRAGLRNRRRAAPGPAPAAQYNGLCHFPAHRQRPPGGSNSRSRRRCPGWLRRPYGAAGPMPRVSGYLSHPVHAGRGAAARREDPWLKLLSNALPSGPAWPSCCGASAAPGLLWWSAPC